MTRIQIENQKKNIETKSIEEVNNFKIQIGVSSASGEAKNELYDACENRISILTSNSAFVEHGDLDDIE